jgi:fructokinase
MPNKRKYTVAAIGEVLWDLFPDGKRLGGAPFNVVCNAQALGSNSSMISRVGNDKLGKEILSAVENKGVDTQHITIDSNHPTGTVSVALDDKGKPDFTIHKNVAWDYLEWNTGLALLAAKCDAIAFGSLAQRSLMSRKTIKKFIKSAPKYGIRIFDINLRQSYFSREIIHESLEFADVLKINDEELPVISNLFDIKGNTAGIIEHLMNLYQLSLVALTRGSKGSLLIRKGEKSDHAGFIVTVADTVGAGDAFTAALIVGMLKGQSLDQINENANRLAAYVCTQRGALPLISDSIKALFS